MKFKKEAASQVYKSQLVKEYMDGLCEAAYEGPSEADCIEMVKRAFASEQERCAKIAEDLLFVSQSDGITAGIRMAKKGIAELIRETP